MPQPPSRKPPSKREAFVALRKAASERRLSVSHREECQEDMERLDHTIEDVREIVVESRLLDIWTAEPDEDPARHDLMVVLRIKREVGSDLYVKFAMALPALAAARLISFHEWGRHR